MISGQRADNYEWIMSNAMTAFEGIIDDPNDPVDWDLVERDGGRSSHPMGSHTIPSIYSSPPTSGWMLLSPPPPEGPTARWAS